MQRHYDIYMEKYRNLDYLEHESQKHRKNEEERKEEQERRLKKMRERLLKEEVDLLRGGRGGDVMTTPTLLCAAISVTALLSTLAAPAPAADITLLSPGAEALD